MAHVVQDRESRIIDAFVELADTLVDDYDVVEFFHRLLEHALTLLGADAGGLLLHHEGALRVAAASDEDMGTLELFELQNSEGPCFDAYTGGDAITVGHLDEADVRLIRGLADVATIAVLQARAIARSSETVGHLQIALDSRVIIEQAKGRVAEHTGHDMQRAFESLRGHARSHNRRLTDVARAVVDGDLAIDDLTPASPRAPAATETGSQVGDS